MKSIKIWQIIKTQSTSWIWMNDLGSCVGIWKHLDLCSLPDVLAHGSVGSLRVSKNVSSWKRVSAGTLFYSHPESYNHLIFWWNLRSTILQACLAQSCLDAPLGQCKASMYKLLCPEEFCWSTTTKYVKARVISNAIIIDQLMMLLSRIKQLCKACALWIQEYHYYFLE